jgi:hypothetical protein
LQARVVVSLEGAIVTEIELAKPVTVVGRHPACDVCIDHPAVSARHMLFRIVNRTVYVEDLASTNGTRVNGHGTQHQVVHHLDMIEVGKHKLHFFDDEMLAAGGVSSLETTVHTDFEKTMMAAHAPAAAATPPARPAPRNDDLSRTMAIPRDSSIRMGAAQETVRTEREASTRALALRALTGMHTGEVVSLEKANTMLGTAGADSALIVRRGDGYYIARLGGSSPRLNRKELEPGAHRIAPRDLIEVGNARFEVITAAA